MRISDWSSDVCSSDLCDFANARDEGEFLHPIVRAIAVHFQIGYDHPFCDGNGRTARALFYWSMLSSGYWLTEYISISSILKKRSEENTSELQSLMRLSYAVFCLKKQTQKNTNQEQHNK